MTIDVAPIIHAGQSEKDELMLMVNGFHMMITSTYGDDIAEHGKAMSALVVTAGTIYGRICAAGIESGSRPRTQRILKTIERNFKAGMEIAQRQAARIMSEQGHMQ